MSCLYVSDKETLKQTLDVHPNLVILLGSNNTVWCMTYVFPEKECRDIYIASNLIEGMRNDYEVREVMTDIPQYKVPVRVLCLRDAFVPNSHHVNKGFPAHMNYKELEVGAVVVCCWIDSPPTTCIVIDVDRHAHNYKGDRSFKAIDTSGYVQRCVHDQIIELVTANGVKKLAELAAKASSMHDTLLAVEQIAQGHANKNLQRISELVSTELNR